MGEVPKGATPPKTLEEIIAYKARVSNPSNQLNHLTSGQLIEYCVRKKHWSTLQMVNICLEVESDRATLRQLLRHSSFSFQEFSFRYAEVNDSLGFVTHDARIQSTKNRQSSYPTDDKKLVDTWNDIQQSMIDVGLEAYSWAIGNGVAKELARTVLPEGMLMSRVYVNGNFRSWYHYLKVRLRRETQKEHRDLAQACYDAILPLIPSLDKLLHLVLNPVTLSISIHHDPSDPIATSNKILHKVLPRVFKESELYHREMNFSTRIENVTTTDQGSNTILVHVVIALKHVLDVGIGECWTGRDHKRYSHVLSNDFEKQDYNGVLYWVRLK